MTYSLVTSSVNVASSLATFNVSTSHKKNETSSQAINIGNLTEQSTVVNVSDAGANAGNVVSTNFTTQTGDLITLSESFNNIVTQASTQYQLFDSQGNIIADNSGTADQQAQYNQWVSGGLSLAADTYTAVATPQSNIAAAISTTQSQGTSLQVSSQLTGSDPNEYYNFTLTSGNNIKLAFDAGSQTSSTRVQILNANGGIVADSAGDAYQKSAYQSLTSGTGLTASTGDYTAVVSYAKNVDPNKNNINYSLQLYSGSTYSVLYQNKVTAQPTDTTALGSVTANSKAQLYARSSYHTIDETAASAINIGWLSQNKSGLQVLSQLTSADNTNYYSLTLQDGSSNLKFGFDSGNTKNPSALRVQLYDASGTRLIADSAGNADQQAIYHQLTTTKGYNTTSGQYVVKISYAPNAAKTDNTYQFKILSGTTYNGLYKTTASAQTYANALLNGNVAGGSGSSASALASYLTAQQNGDTETLNSQLTSALQAFI